MNAELDMKKFEDEMKERTKKFSLRILKLSQALPITEEGRVIKRQIVRSGTSVGSNYRAVCRARSGAEFVSKLGIVIEESDETAFWLEVIIDSGMLKKELVLPLLNETNELVAIFVTSIKTKKKNLI